MCPGGSELASFHSRHQQERSGAEPLRLLSPMKLKFAESFFPELSRREGAPGDFCPSSANYGPNFQRHCGNATRFPLAVSLLSGGSRPSETSVSLQQHSSDRHRVVWRGALSLHLYVVSCFGLSASDLRDLCRPARGCGLAPHHRGLTRVLPTS